MAGSALPTSEISADAASDLSSDALLPQLLDARAVAPILDFSKSSYIWTGEQTGMAHTAPAGMRPFRVEIPSSAMKCPTCATIIVACDDQCPVYVNGQQIGTGRAPQQGAVVYTAGLNPDSKNVFAIGMSNTAEGSAGLIATILVDYTDGTTETIISNSTWKTLKGVAPSGWTSPSFDDSTWTAADVEGPSMASPWGALVLPPAINMTTAGALPQRRSLRLMGNPLSAARLFSPCMSHAVFLYSCSLCLWSSREDSYTLYVNGKIVRTGSTWRAMQAYSLPQLEPDVNVVAVDGANLQGNTRVWLRVGVLIAYNDGSSEMYLTDGTWKTLNALPPAGFEQPDADDSEWVGATL
ncbi:lectin, partial [Desarmillaria tabescens]